MAAPPTEAVRLQTIDPGAGRRAWGVLLALVSTLGVLAWQPWDGGERAAAVVPSPPGPTDVAVVVPPTSTPRPEAARVTPSRPFGPPRVAGLPEDWGVVAERQQATAGIMRGADEPTSPELLVETYPVDASTVSFTQLGTAILLCAEGEMPQPAAAAVRADGLRVLGVTVPRSAVRARITVTRIGADGLGARQVAGRTRRLEAERIRPPYALFALPTYRVWPAGVYRFDVHLPGGAFRHLYACVFD